MFTVGSFLLTAVLGLAGYIISKFIWQIYFSRSNGSRIPGPPIINEKEGNLRELRQAETLSTYIEGLHNKYGPIVLFYMGPQPVVSIGSAELFQESMQSKLFDRPEVLFKPPLVEVITASSIQLTNGPEGRRRHALYSHFFNATAKFFPQFQKCIDEISSSLAGSDGPILLKPIAFDLTLSVMSKCAFAGVFAESELTRLISFYDLWSSDIEKKLKGRDIDEGTAYPEQIRKIVEDALSKRRRGEVLIWAIYFLAKQPDIQDKLAREMRQNLSGSSENWEIVPEDVERLPYLRQVLNETLRLRSPGPFAARISDKSHQLGGFQIPPNMPVMHAIGYVTHHQAYYEQPQSFDPEHFSPENVQKRHPFAFKPFGFAGNRMCPGNRFAVQEASVSLALLISRFHFRLVGDVTATPNVGFVTRPNEEIWVTVEPRR
ncbi:putative Cytochrome P450 20A1 [Hypsibius exemplaris]|uniref:Cytochrome P450 20A1 n=1 Tax=Hypsibius exemplaris TaxID=2072580 RepID=A0A9X6NAQ1_HYPEX|nr:putative Cytochrome P450 20A1 [Hypsibius exemplaris]